MGAAPPEWLSSDQELEALRRELAETRETLEAIRTGEVDALVVRQGATNRVFTLQGADHAYRLFVEEMNQGAVTLGQGSVVLYGNEAFAQMVQQDPARLTGSAFEALVAPASRQAWAALEAAARTGKASAEITLSRPDGTELPALVAAVTPRGHEAAGLILVVTDLTGQLRYERLAAAEREARAGEERLRAILDVVLDAIVVVDDDGRFLEANPAAQRLLGTASAAPEALWRRLEEAGPLPLELPLEQAGGQALTVEAYRVMAILPGRHLLVIHDLTARKREEEARARLDAQIQEVQQREALTVLTGGVAHDFNNLLAAILGNASLAKLSLAPDSPEFICFRGIEAASLRAADLVRQLQAHAGKGVFTPEPVDLNITVQEVLQVQRASLPPYLTLSPRLAHPAPVVRGDATQVFQMLLNLYLNAVEASPAGDAGIVAVATGQGWLDEARPGPGTWILTPPAGRYGWVEVLDGGPGLAPGLLARAFEPFFTTKFIGRGLGLAAVLGMVRRHGGGIRVDTAPGRGARFTVFLPLPPPEPTPTCL